MQHTITVSSSRRIEILDITSEVKEMVKDFKEGLCNIYTPHATASIIINENYDPNCCVDLNNLLSQLIPAGKWLHDRVDGNADSHIKASILGPQETVPIKDGKLQLGTWQSIMLADFDGPRERKIIITVIS